jgi:hypothetical protein
MPNIDPRPRQSEREASGKLSFEDFRRGISIRASSNVFTPYDVPTVKQADGPQVARKDPFA